LAETLVGFDEEDPDTRPVARPPLGAVAASEPPLPPRLAFVRSPVWERAEPETREAFAEFVRTLGGAVVEVELGESFARAVEMHRTIMEVEMAHNLRRDYEKGRDRLSPVLREAIERGRRHAAVDYAAAVAGIPSLNVALEAVFDEFDAILTPAAPGEAPHGLETTGDPIFCTIWTYLGTPAVTLPLLQSAAGMPLGVQLVGRRDGDARLLRTARWLVESVGGARPRRRRKRSGAGEGESPHSGRRKSAC
ncbi:MAG: amidase, partial [Candidatus Rokubacteria bacterium]|nr:amidase [Candidatus Rokubacteria bacterium]